MKNLFAILMVSFMLIGMSITTSVQASNVGIDIDVGYALHTPAFTASIADMNSSPATTEINAVPDLMTAFDLSPHQSCAAQSANRRYEAIASKRNYQYWEGGDSKASLRKAVYRINIYTKAKAYPMIDSTLKYGKGTRRLRQGR